MQCVSCGSTRVESRHYARRLCSVVGGAIGAFIGVSNDDVGDQVNRLIGQYGGVMLSQPVRQMASYLLAGFIAGTVGSRMGEAFGRQIDESILNNYHCLACGHSFQQPPAPEL